MNPEIERLIKLAIADGVVTEKERAIILRKAESLGLDKDEIEMILDGELASMKDQKKVSQSKTDEFKKEQVTKCPSCGGIIQGLSQVCESCGYLLNRSTIQGENSKNLHDTLHKLEELIIEVKSVPKPSIGERLKIVFLTYISLGIYLIYRKIFHKKGESFENLIAKCDKEKRQISVYYGEDSKVKKLLSELDTEISRIQKGRSQSLRTANLGCLGIVIIFIGLYSILGLWSYNQSKDYLGESNKGIDSLISIGQIDQAKSAALKITSDYKRNEALDKVKEYEFKRLLEGNKIDSARNKANSITSDYKRKEAIDNVLIYEVNRFIEAGDIESAKAKINAINSDSERKEMKDKILIIEIDKLIETKDFEKAKDKANQIDNSYDRKDALEKIKNANN